MAGHLYLKGTHVQYPRLCSSSYQMITILYGKHRESARALEHDDLAGLLPS